jgi:PAS domain S-box-containing protein
MVGMPHDIDSTVASSLAPSASSQPASPDAWADANELAATLRRRVAILSAVCHAATRFLTTADWDRDIAEVLATLGSAAEVSRVNLVETWRDDQGAFLANLRQEWTAPGMRSRMTDADAHDLPIEARGLGRWATLVQGDTIYGNVSTFSESERAFFTPTGIRSLAIMPVFAGASRWGYLGMTDDVGEREWPTSVLDALRAAAAMLGAAIYRQHSEVELRESEERYHRLSEAAVEGIFIHDHGIVLEANSALVHMFGYPLEELIGRSAFDWAPAPCSPAMTVGDHAFDFDACYEARGVRKDGSAIVTEIHAGPTTYRGRPARIVTMLDITERKEAEATRLRLEEERAARSMAEAATQARDEVLGIVAHDLRDPLGTVLMASQLVAELVRPEPPELQKQLDVIRRAAERMRLLIQDLLDVKRIESGTLTVVLSPTDATALLAEAYEQLSPLARASGLELELEARGALPYVAADPARVHQVLSNLVGNAIKFTPRGGRVTMCAEDLSPVVCFAVSDTGPGIPPEHLAQVFGKMWQATRGDHRGIGLGLTIAKGIVDAHGGRIWAESTVGEGSTFFFTLRVSI